MLSPESEAQPYSREGLLKEIRDLLEECKSEKIGLPSSGNIATILNNDLNGLSLDLLKELGIYLALLIARHHRSVRYRMEVKKHRVLTTAAITMIVGTLSLSGGMCAVLKNGTQTAHETHQPRTGETP